jgi:hypothetical protein
MAAGREFRWRGRDLIAPERRLRPPQKREHLGGLAVRRRWLH